MADDAALDTPGEPTPQDTPAPAPEPAEKSWRDTYLPEPLRGEKTFQKFKDVGALAESYRNLEKLTGNSVKVPGADATEADWAAFADKVRPADVAQYGVKAKVPDGLDWNDAAEAIMVGEMHKAGVPARAAQQVLDRYLAIARDGTIQAAQQRHASATETYEALRDEWGGQTERNIGLVQRVVAEFGGPEATGLLDRTGLGNHPDTVRMLQRIGEVLLEDGLVEGGGLGLDKSGAQTEYDTLMGDRKGPLYDRAHPGHDAAVERIRDLGRVIFNVNG